MTRFSGVVCLIILQSCAAFAPTKPSLLQRNIMNMNSDLEPVTDKMQASSTVKKLGAAAGFFGLVFGKRFLDGPGRKLSCTPPHADAALNDPTISFQNFVLMQLHLLINSSRHLRWMQMKRDICTVSLLNHFCHSCSLLVSKLDLNHLSISSLRWNYIHGWQDCRHYWRKHRVG